MKLIYKHHSKFKKLNFFSKDVLRSTVHRCTERFNDTELYLVGSMNTSTILANRTKRLIEELKPDIVYVQAPQEWGRAIELLQYVKSQEEMNKANNHLSQFVGIRSLNSNIRFQLFNIIYKSFAAIPFNLNPFAPGLEVKYAIESAKKVGAKVVYLDSEFDDKTIGRIKHEKRFTLFKFIREIFKSNSRNYICESIEFSSIIKNKGFDAFVENSMDSKQVSFFIAILDKLFPEYKRIFVDRKDEDIFQKIISNKGKRMVAVVNQHHMEGLEHHWCSSFGSTPTFNNDFALETINPIGDLPLRQMLYERMYHVIKREIKSSRLRAPPATYTNEINIYHREFNHQFEHRNM